LGEGLLLGAGLVALSFELREGGLQFGAFLLPVAFVLERSREPLDLALGDLAALVRLGEAGAGDGRVALVPVEPEDAAEDLLPLARLLLRELVRAALEEERRVDERVVVESDRLVDHGLGLVDGARRERL